MTNQGRKQVSWVVAASLLTGLLAGCMATNRSSVKASGLFTMQAIAAERK